MSPTLVVPSPPAFLDPLTDVESSYYYAVPKFYSQDHPSTRWMINMIKNSEEDRLKHKMETSPNAFRGVYYQMLDYPQMYIPEDVAASAMFKRQAVAYLTPLGMAIYLGKVEIVNMFLAYRDMYDDPVCDPNEAQYATHLQDNEFGDFHAYPPFVVMLRRSGFACAQALMHAGWDPSKPVAMPMRRKFERRVLYFRDWLEVALSVMATRSMYPLQVLVRELFKGTTYKAIRMPLAELLPEKPEAADPAGLIDVDQLPPGVLMIGVRSLLDMAEHYDRYLQIRQCAKQVADLKREAVSVGLNPEVLMIQAQDFDGGDIPQPDQTDNSNAGRGANNSSAEDPGAGRQQLDVNMSAANKKGKKNGSDPEFTSEGCRVLHFALMRDPTGKSMQTCLEAFCVMLRRGFYLLPAKPAASTSQARDMRNMAVLLLNLIQREQSKVDTFVEKIKSGVKRFAHLEEHKQLENRKTACIQFIARLVGVLTKLLLHAKMLVDFIQADFPPYSPSLTDIPLNPYLAQNFQDIKFGIIREFNLCNDAWVFLDKEMLRTVSGMPEMQLHMKVGKKPTKLPKSLAKQAAKAANKNKSNMMNTNSCFVTYTRVQRRRPKPAPRAPMAHDTPTTSSLVGDPSLTASLAQPCEESSTDCLPMDSSADLVTGETVVDLNDLNASAFPDIPGDLPAAAEAPTEAVAAVGDCSDMEQLLASLCREVDSLFRPLEDSSCDGEEPCAETTGCAAKSERSGASRNSDGAALGRKERSTIEPELATTPLPTPEPSPAHNNTALDTAADVGAPVPDASRALQLNRPKLPPALRKKLKQSGVRQRLISRRPAVRDCELGKTDADTETH